MNRLRDPNRGKFWFHKYAGLSLFLALAGLFCWWCIPRAPDKQLNYGRLLQLLNDPQVQFQEVEVTPTEV
jgi:hypothetical protein